MSGIFGESNYEKRCRMVVEKQAERERIKDKLRKEHGDELRKSDNPAKLAQEIAKVRYDNRGLYEDAYRTSMAQIGEEIAEEIQKEKDFITGFNSVKPIF